MDKTQQNTIRNSIGDNAQDDYILQPENHAQLYEEKLPELAKLLQNSTVQHLAGEYKQQDREAIVFQKKFKSYSAYARLFTFLAATFSATLIMSGTLTGIEYVQDNFPKLPQIILTVSTILTIIFSGISSIFIMIIKNLKLLEKWMKNRAVAEEIRLHYFQKLVDLYHQQPGPELGVALLEYFRRYQLDMQIAYYKKRADELSRKSSNAIAIIAILSGLVIIINGMTGFLGLDWAFLAALAIIVQAYSSAVSNRELSDQNERNAERYEGLRRELALIKSRIDTVRQGIAQGNHEVLGKFVKAVQDPMAAEHRQWLETMGSSTAAVSELEAELSKINVEQNS